MNKEDVNCNKFPCVLKEKMEQGEFVFPDDVCFDYEPFIAYRGIDRKEDDYNQIDRRDFKSYAELKVTRRGININDPHYYGVSLYLLKEQVENALKFPRNNKKIAVGTVYCEGGPVDLTEETGHVCWWLYENVNLSGFKIC